MILGDKVFLIRNIGYRIVLPKNILIIKEALGKRGLSGRGSESFGFDGDLSLRAARNCRLNSYSAILAGFLRLNCGEYSHQATDQPVASNFRRARNRFIKAASTLIVQRF